MSIDLNQRYPRLNQSSSEQATLPNFVSAVSVSHLWRFAAELERLTCSAACEQIERLLQVGLVSLPNSIAARCSLGRINQIQ